jgi:hypothetical protein
MRVWIAFFILTIATPVYAQTTTGSTSGASSMVNISSPANTTTHLITTPTVVPPGLAAAGIETCLGSASGGLSLMGGGITFGATKVDDGCTIRLLARQLYAFGLHNAAVALMCQDRRVAAAMDVAGSPCPVPPAGSAGRVADVPTTGSVAEDVAPAATAQGGYILDLKSSDSGAPGQTSIYVATTPIQPLLPEQQAWFDRASNVN